jgi:hypothetical protein
MDGGGLWKSKFNYNINLSLFFSLLLVYSFHLEIYTKTFTCDVWILKGSRGGENEAINIFSSLKTNCWAYKLMQDFKKVKW